MRKDLSKHTDSIRYNMRQVQYLAGHRYISSTESCLQNQKEGLKEEAGKYHPLG